MFPMPRVVYSISSDGLIFKFLSNVMEKVKTPAVATIVTGLLTGNFFVVKKFFYLKLLFLKLYLHQYSI